MTLTVVRLVQESSAPREIIRPRPFCGAKESGGAVAFGSCEPRWWGYWARRCWWRLPPGSYLLPQFTSLLKVVALRLAFRFDSSASLATVGVMLHERIARLRVAAGLGQRELCRLAGLNPTFLSRARVSSQMVPRADLVVAIAHVLGTTADWLVAGHGEAPTDAAVVAAVRAARVRSSSIKAA